MALSMDRHFFAAERKRLGFIQEKFASVLSVNIYTVKKWEGGRRKIPPEMGYVLAALEKGLEPIGVHNAVPIPHVMGYVFAALQAGLKPLGKDHLVEFVGRDGDD